MKEEYKFSLEYASERDLNDPLYTYRDKFFIPKSNGKEVIYFTGNSLGLQPKSIRNAVEQELDKWADQAVEGHFLDPNPWMYYHKFTKENLALLTGAKESEVVSMNNLTVNLHLMMASFYQPKGKRFKILMEKSAFPSDQYAVESQVKFHGYNPKDAIIELEPESELDNYISEERILDTINVQGEEIALILMSGVQYYSGQFFNIKSITKAGHHAGAFVGFDLAHAIGNLPLNLHEDGPDFATWCSYKYLNSGPGNVSGIFVHDRHKLNEELPRFAGWWGHNEKERFLMKKGFIPMEGADGWQLSNVNVLGTAAHRASLELFAEVGMTELRKKSMELTGYLEWIVNTIDSDLVKILTPSNPEERGCQLSLYLRDRGKEIFSKLEKNGIVADWREPNVIRVAPVPFYNTFSDVYHFGKILKEALA